MGSCEQGSDCLPNSPPGSSHCPPCSASASFLHTLPGTMTGHSEAGRPCQRKQKDLRQVRERRAKLGAGRLCPGQGRSKPLSTWEAAHSPTLGGPKSGGQVGVHLEQAPERDPLLGRQSCQLLGHNLKPQCDPVSSLTQHLPNTFCEALGSTLTGH